MKGELVDPKRTALKRKVLNLLSGLAGSESQRNLVTSLSLSSSLTGRNAFSMSATMS